MPVYKPKVQILRVARNERRILRFEQTVLSCLLQWGVQQSKILFELLDPEDRGNKVLRNDGKSKQSSRCHALEDLKHNCAHFPLWKTDKNSERM